MTERKALVRPGTNGHLALWSISWAFVTVTLGVAFAVFVSTPLSPKTLWLIITVGGWLIGTFSYWPWVHYRRHQPVSKEWRPGNPGSVRELLTPGSFTSLLVGAIVLGAVATADGLMVAALYPIQHPTTVWVLVTGALIFLGGFWWALWSLQYRVAALRKGEDLHE